MKDHSQSVLITGACGDIANGDFVVRHRDHVTGHMTGNMIIAKKDNLSII